MSGIPGPRLRVPLAVLFFLAAPLGAQEPGAAYESEARALIAEIEALRAKGKDPEAWSRLCRRRSAPTAGEVAGGAARRLERLRLEVGLAVVGGAADLAADVAPAKNGSVVLRYDFQRDGEAAFADFEDLDPVPDARYLERRKLSLSGTGALCHRAPFVGDLAVTIVGVPRSEHDLGPIILDPDEEMGDRFLVGCLDNTYFGIKYGRDRRRTEGDALLFCGRGAESRATNYPTQLLGVISPTKVRRGEELTVALSWKGRSVKLSLGGSTVTHELTPATQTLRRKQTGLFLRRSAFILHRMTIEGRPDPAWLEARAAEIRARLR